MTKNDFMNKKSEAAFATWCLKKSVHFMSSPIIRKREKNSNSRYRELYVLKDEYIGNRLLVIFAKNSCYCLFQEIERNNLHDTEKNTLNYWQRNKNCLEKNILELVVGG
jgi:hypothetical protein